MKKLRETLVAVQQLDKNMSSLRSWLAHIETELSKPIAYDACDFQEIQRKLDLQQVTYSNNLYSCLFIFFLMVCSSVNILGLLDILYYCQLLTLNDKLELSYFTTQH